MSDLLKYVAALVPSTGVGFLFYLIIRAMLEGDRRERRALAKWEAEHRAGPEPVPQPDPANQNTRADPAGEPGHRKPNDPVQPHGGTVVDPGQPPAAPEVRADQERASDQAITKPISEKA